MIEKSHFVVIKKLAKCDEILQKYSSGPLDMTKRVLLNVPQV